MRLIKQSTSYNLMVLMVQSSDHVTGATGLTLTIAASKDGGAFASISPTVTERGNGWYNLALTAAHTDTVGDLALRVTGSGADPSDIAMQVRANVLGDTLPANVTQFGGSNGTFASGRPEVNATHAAGTAWGSGAITAAAIASDAITAAKIADGAIDAGTFASGAITAAAIASNAITAAKVATDAIGAAQLATDAVNEIKSGLSTLDAAGIRAAVGLASANLDTQLAAIAGFIDTEVAAILAEVDTEVAAIKAKTDNLPASPAATGDIPSAATISTQVASDLATAHGAGSWATATGFSTHSAADVWGAADRTLTAGTNIALAKGTGVTGFNDPDAAAIAAAVRDVDNTAPAADSLGAAVNDAAAAGGGLDAAGVRSAVGLAAADLDDQLDAIKADTAATLADTGTDGVVVAAGSKAGYTLSTVGIDAILARTLTEGYAAPDVVPTLQQALMMILQRLVEFGISGTEITVRGRDGTTEAFTLTLDSAATPTSATQAS